MYRFYHSVLLYNYVVMEELLICTVHMQACVCIALLLVYVMRNKLLVQCVLQRMGARGAMRSVCGYQFGACRETGVHCLVLSVFFFFRASWCAWAAPYVALTL
jgi:hypothetical protein